MQVTGSFLLILCRVFSRKMDSGRFFLFAFSTPHSPLLPKHVTQKKSCYHGRWKSNEKHLSRWLLFFWLNDWWLFGFFFRRSSSGLSRREKIDFHMKFSGWKVFLQKSEANLKKKVSRQVAGYCWSLGNKYKITLPVIQLNFIEFFCRLDDWLITENGCEFDDNAIT